MQETCSRVSVSDIRWPRESKAPWALIPQRGVRIPPPSAPGAHPTPDLKAKEVGVIRIPILQMGKLRQEEDNDFLKVTCQERGRAVTLKWKIRSRSSSATMVKGAR